MKSGYSAGSKQFQRQVNIALVMDLIRRARPISRIEIARRLGLDRSTITHITSRLFDEGCLRVHSEGDATSRGGRKPTMLALNPEYGCAIGIDLTPDACRAFVADFVGAPLWRGSFPLAGEGVNPAASIQASIEKAISEAKQTDHVPLGVGIAVPGVVAPDRGTIIESREFGLSSYDLAREAATWTDLPLLLDNDARCCAYGEIAAVRQGAASTPAADPAASTPSFLFVMGRFQPSSTESKAEPLLKQSGMGIGIGVVIDGRVHTGAHYTAGEFCSASWLAGAPGQLGMNGQELSRIHQDEPLLRKAFQELLTNLTPLVSVLDPAEIILGGEFRRQYPVVRDILDTDLKSSYLGQRSGKWSLRLSSNGEWETAAGAAWMFIEQLFAVPVPERRIAPPAMMWEEVFSRSSRPEAARPL